ncbi:MAG: hypothetical protein ACRYGM_13835, partial [Janthinobacterium lividum]
MKRTLMTRIGKILLWLLAVLVALPVVTVALLFAGLNTEFGRGQAASLVGRLTGGTVVFSGLSGRFPDHLRLAHVELRDTQGAWLQADDLALDWSPTALIHKQALVHSLTAARFAMPRLPASDPAAAPAAPSSQPFTLPVRVTVEHLALARAELGRAVIGADAVLAGTGQADVRSLQSGTAAIALQPVGAEGRYTLDASLADDSIAATLHAQEPDHGLLARLASLPDLGAIKLDLTTKGPRNALATTLALTAGPLAAQAQGDIDLVNEALKVDLTARAPAMTPAPGVSWAAIDLDAHVAGPFTRPDANGHLRLDSLAVAGASLRSLNATLAGNAGRASIEARLDALRIPGPSPALLEAAPILVQATAQLDDPARPVRFTVTHPLLQARGTATTGASPDATVTLTLPDLTPIGAIGGVDLAGNTELTLHTTQSAAATSIEANGTLALTRAPGPAAALIGEHATLALAASLAGQDVTLRRLSLNGAALTLDATGVSSGSSSGSGPGIDATVKAALSNLALAAPTLTGNATLDAHVTGQPSRLAVDAVLAGDVGAPGIPRAPVKLTAALTGLPERPAGSILGEGALAGAPIQLALKADRTP